MSLGIIKHGQKLGIKQRLGIGGPSPDGEQGLVTPLKKLYSKGKLSAGEVGGCAASVSRPGQTLKKLARAQGKPNPVAQGEPNPGTAASSSRALVNNNNSRSLQRALNATATLGPPYIAQIPM